jgi:23S rRNA (cytidine1920-2'-O)/16S rRNA (cytidine1409-2'-O)-methyltransferase
MSLENFDTIKNISFDLKNEKMKKRLDKILCYQYPLWSRSYIQEVIHQGLVKVNGIVQLKSSYQVSDIDCVDADIKHPQFVSRAGYKLDYALREFNCSVKDLVALDSGLSTGGFTDCLLQHGARHVYGVDVGTAQVHKKISLSKRVTVIEQTDLRDVKIDQLVDIVTLDLSFISLLKVMAAVRALIRDGGHLIVLIKPQFEVGKENIGSQGIVYNENIRDETVQRVIAGIQSYNFELKEWIVSPMTGKTGNTEYLAYFVCVK